jgi:hypothetical protein
VPLRRCRQVFGEHVADLKQIERPFDQEVVCAFAESVLCEMESATTEYKTTGTVAVTGFCRISRRTSVPSMPGIITSTPFDPPSNEARSPREATSTDK